MNLLTIFTPTFNRAHLLQRVYDSLLVQTANNFEWVIVDDGSSDNTCQLIEKFVEERRLKIIFEKQINAGKHVAINRGLKLASGALFLILDSDDALTFDAVKEITFQWNNLKQLPDFDRFGGIVVNKCYMNGNVIGNDLNYDIMDTTIIDYRFRKKITGDKLEIFKTDLLKQFPFPENGEKFCPEGLVWNRIGSVYRFRFLNKAIYKVEYLPDGLSDKIVKIRVTSPRNSSQYYAELTKYHIPLIQKMKAGINYWRFCLYDKSSTFTEKLKRLNLLLSLFGLPLAVILALMDKNNK